MSSRNLYGDNSASTPIGRCTLPRTTISVIDSASSQRYGKRGSKNDKLSSSSDFRDSKERLLSGNAIAKAVRRRRASRTPDDSLREKRTARLNKRKIKARRQIENPDSDETNWQTTRENTLSRVADRDDLAEVPIDVAATGSCKAKVPENADSSDGAASYGWVKLHSQAQANPNREPEVLRNATRVLEDYDRILEKPLHHLPDPGAEVKSDLPTIVPFIDLDTDIEVIVNDHEKKYPAARNNEAREKFNMIGTREWENQQAKGWNDQPKKRHIRNREEMKKLRKGNKGGPKTSAVKRGYPYDLPKQSSSGKTAMKFCTLGLKSVKTYELDSSYEYDDYFHTFSKIPVNGKDISSRFGDVKSRGTINRSSRIDRSKKRFKENGKSARRSKIPSRKRHRNDSPENRITDYDDSSSSDITDFRATDRRKRARFSNSWKNRPLIESESDETDSSASDRRSVNRRRRIYSKEVEFGESSRQTSLDKSLSYLRANENTGKKSVLPGEKSVQPIEVEKSSKKKHRRITTLIYLDSSDASEVSVGKISDRQNRQNRPSVYSSEEVRQSLPKIEETLDYEPDETLIIDQREIGECSETSVSTETMLDTIFQESAVVGRSSRDEKRKIRSRSSSTQSSSIESEKLRTDRPKIVSVKVAHNRVVERHSLNRWRVNVPSDFDDEGKDTS